MTDSPVPRYLFGIPPKDYDPEYFREVLRTFSLFQTQLANPGKVTANELNLKPANAGGYGSLQTIEMPMMQGCNRAMYGCYLQERYELLYHQT